MADVLDRDSFVNKFELQSRYYVHFRTNILGKGMNPPLPFPAIQLNSIGNDAISSSKKVQEKKNQQKTNQFWRCHKPVAERTSYFCLARKLIWPLGSSHIFTQWGWLILLSPDHFSRQHQITRQTLSSSEPFKKDRRIYCPLSSLAAASRHHEESHLIYRPLESVLLDQEFLVEYELDESIRHT